jgi:hypothetical protein
LTLFLGGVRLIGDMGRNGDIVKKGQKTVEVPTTDEIIRTFKETLLPVAMEVYLKLMSSTDEKIKKEAADKVTDICIGSKVKHVGEGGGGSISLPLDKIKGALVGLRMVDDGEEKQPEERLARPWDTESLAQDNERRAGNKEESE